MEAKFYYECHITIDPVFDDERERASKIASMYGFKLANLLMKKRKVETEKVSDKDTFMTAHSKSLVLLRSYMIWCIQQLQREGFSVRRYKIEDIILDSRYDDIYGLIKQKTESTTS